MLKRTIRLWTAVVGQLSQRTFVQLQTLRPVLGRLGLSTSGFLLFRAVPFLSKTVQSEVKSEEQKLKAVIKRSDILYDNYLIDNVYTGLSHYKHLDNPELLWRLARVTYELAKQTQNKEQRKELTYEAMGYIQRALDLEPPEGISPLNKWYGILYDKTAEYEGNKERIHRSNTVRQHFERAVELNPRDATSTHLLGLWHFSFADMPRYQRAIAALIFGKPPESTYDNALECFLKAEKIDPKFYTKNLLYIAKCLLALNRKEEVGPYLKTIVGEMVVTMDDMEAFTEAHKLMKKLGLNKEN